MNRIYGITTCGSVKKATAFFKSHNLEYEFIDLKKIHVEQERLKCWLEKKPMSVLFNTKGVKFKTLGLDKNMGDEQKFEWLQKEQLLFKRPIIELENGELLVGFDEGVYEEQLL